LRHSVNIISDHVSPAIENGFAVISTQQPGTERVAYSRLIPWVQVGGII